MTTRDRWTVYPLLFLAIGLGLNANLQSQADHSTFESQTVRSKKLDGDVVLCKEIVVVNDSGKPVLRMAANEKSGAGILEARNGEGKIQVVLSADPPGGVLRTLDVTGKYFQFPSIERRPFPLLPADQQPPNDEQAAPNADDDKAAK